MIRRDYILRAVEDFARMLARVRERVSARQFEEAREELDKSFLELTGKGPDEFGKLSTSELLALLTIDEPTHVVRQKSHMLIALLQESGEMHVAAGREPEGQACWLKALDLTLTVLMRDSDGELPEFVPKIEMLHEQLRDTALPLGTLAGLWRHYERIGAYGRAEDVLYGLREAEPNNEALLKEAKMFYGRLWRQSDEALVAGNLPRAEVETALNELQ